jgi:hypothetical protein
LSSIVDWNTDENVRLVWSDFKDLFKQEYAVQTNDKLILEGLSNLAMKSNETTNELLTRITRTTRVIRESFDEYNAKILYPHNDINGGISNNASRRFLRQYDAMWINFFKMNLYAGTQIGGGTAGARNHHHQENVPGSNHGPAGAQGQRSSPGQGSQRRRANGRKRN